MSVDYSEKTESELVVLSAADGAALAALATKYADFLDRVSGVPLLDVAYTASLTRGPARLAIVASDTKDLRARLVSAAGRIAGGAKRVRDKSGTYYQREPLLGGETGGKIAFVYPGVMSFYPDMLRDVVVAHPECRVAFDELEEALSGTSDFTPSNFIFPPAPYYRHDADIFSAGAFAQALVSVYAASAALERLLRSLGLKPDAVTGSMGGDLSEVLASGAVGPRSQRVSRLNAIREIYSIVDKAVDHQGLEKVVTYSAMLRHEGDADPVRAAVGEEKMRLVIELSPRRQVYAVKPEFEQEVLNAFSAAGIRARRLSLDRPFNTPMCLERVVPAVRKFTIGNLACDPKRDVYSTRIADRLPAKVRVYRDDIAERWAGPVRFAETIRKMHSDGVRVFVEVGPRGILSGAIDDTLAGSDYAAVALNSIHRRGVLQLQHGVAQLCSLGAEIDLAPFFRSRRARELDLSAIVPHETRREVERRLSRAFPRMTLIGAERQLTGADYLAEPKGRGAKGERKRQAELKKEAALFRQFDFGAVEPMISDAEEIASEPGIRVELEKTFSIAEEKFIADFALGANQITCAPSDLRGAVFLTMSIGLEIIAEAAMHVIPGLVLASVENVRLVRHVPFVNDRLRLRIRAERTESPDREMSAVKVTLSEPGEESQFTAPIMSATVLLARTAPAPTAFRASELYQPRAVHWDGREIYPSRLSCGRRLWNITGAELWAPDGLNYEVEVPRRTDCVKAAAFPLWAVDPILLESIASGFHLWRSHEKFVGAFSLPFAVRRVVMRGAMPKEGTKLKCYMRLTGVTSESHISEITVTDGTGNAIIEITGWEEATRRVPKGYCEMLLKPVSTFITEKLSAKAIGEPAIDYATAFITDVPYALFERDEAFWLSVLGNVSLAEAERGRLAGMKGAVARATEWLFGRIAAKEAVRRFLWEKHQARWCDADVVIHPDQSGKPRAIGEWREFISSKFDIAIAHTAQFIVAIATTNARVGIDVESVARALSKEFAEGVFGEEEIELAAQSAKPAEAFIRFWCAKEAVSKALGCGIRYPPKELVITGFESETGAIVARLTGAWEANYKGLKGRDIAVASSVIRDHALATCFISTGFFADE